MDKTGSINNLNNILINFLCIVLVMLQKQMNSLRATECEALKMVANVDVEAEQIFSKIVEIIQNKRDELPKIRSILAGQLEAKGEVENYLYNDYANLNEDIRQLGKSIGLDKVTIERVRMNHKMEFGAWFD